MVRITICENCSQPISSGRADKRFCSRECQFKRAKNMARSRFREEFRTRPTTFVGIDGEGVTDEKTGKHSYVLLGVGNEQISDETGLDFNTIFSFLYSCMDHEHERKTAFVGFFLGYDFTQWFKTFPAAKAAKLLTSQGQAQRKNKVAGRPPVPVSVDDWQVDILGGKRFKLRPKTCDCVYCKHPKKPWMYICDTGSFFQTSFLNVIDPDTWAVPIVTREEYETIKKGKEIRSDAVLDDDMRRYNRLENVILAERVLPALEDGLRQLSVGLSVKQWFGPGQAAQKWMKGCAPTSEDIRKRIPILFLEAARKSYFGGWFEIMCHGYIPGITWEYDINSAYPFIISRLPCLLHGRYESGTTDSPPDLQGSITFVFARVWSKPEGSSDRTYIGGMPFRDASGSIRRPVLSEGWINLAELEGAKRAGLVCSADISEWHAYHPCDCPPPLRGMEDLYLTRLRIGKDTPLGKGSKLIYNSVSGKFAQSVGDSIIFGNPVYACLITSGCRIMILDAIASHPKGKSDVLMVATDGVYFRSPHPDLPLGNALGKWEEKQKRNLTLFKPGVYWDDKAREAIQRDELPSFKARGISPRDFSAHLSQIDDEFRSMPMDLRDAQWPAITYESRFAMVSALTALRRNQWDLAGAVTHPEITQSADPSKKRQDPYWDGDIIRSEPWPPIPLWSIRDRARSGYADMTSCPYEKRFGLADPHSQESREYYGITPDGTLTDTLASALREANQ